jgi:hypothetical protein
VRLRKKGLPLGGLASAAVDGSGVLAAVAVEGVVKVGLARAKLSVAVTLSGVCAFNAASSVTAFPA